MGCHKHCPLPQQQDGSSGSGTRDADNLPLPEVPKQRRRRRKPEQQPKEFTIDDLNPISSAWAGCLRAKSGQQLRVPNQPVHWAAARRPARCGCQREAAWLGILCCSIPLTLLQWAASPVRCLTMCGRSCSASATPPAVCRPRTASRERMRAVVSMQQPTAGEQLTERMQMAGAAALLLLRVISLAWALGWALPVASFPLAVPPI